MKFKNFKKILLLLWMLSSLSGFSAQAQQPMNQAETDLPDEEQIRRYLTNNGITAKRTKSGLYYVIANRGSGQSPAQGKIVIVHYTGYLLNGQKFDSSYDRNQPLAFSHKTGQMIQGFDEGVALLKKGGKATLFIPSKLGYGSNPTGVIPPFSVLRFEIEVVNVK